MTISIENPNTQNNHLTDQERSFRNRDLGTLVRTGLTAQKTLENSLEETYTNSYPFLPDLEHLNQQINNGNQAAHSLTEENLGLVIFVIKQKASEYCIQHPDHPLNNYSDLIAVGNLALLTAVLEGKYDPERDEFSTYMYYWIFRDISLYLNRNRNDIRIPPKFAKKHTTYLRLNYQLSLQLGHPPTSQEIINASGNSLTPKNIQQCIDYNNAQRIIDLDALLTTNYSSKNTEETLSFIADPSTPDPATEVDTYLAKEELKTTLEEVLSERERSIIYNLFVNDQTHQTISESYGVSRRRIGQILEESHEKLRQHLESKPDLAASLRTLISN